VFALVICYIFYKLVRHNIVVVIEISTTKTKTTTARKSMVTNREALFIFHRDLRVVDNTALRVAAQACGADAIFPVFIMPDEQIDASANTYFSRPAVQFMCECLTSLVKETKGTLRIVRAPDNVTAVRALLAANPGITHVVFNADSTAYAKRRDAAIADACRTMSVECIAVDHDYDLTGLHEVLSATSGKPYTNLSQFFTRWLSSTPSSPGSTPGSSTPTSSRIGGSLTKDTDAHVVEKLQVITLPRPLPPGIFIVRPNVDLPKLYAPALKDPAQTGGRKEGEAALRRIAALAGAYARTRDAPALGSASTTLCSAHLKFGTISIREAVRAACSGFPQGRPHQDNALLRELAFREFYRKIYILDERLQQGSAYRAELDAALPWKQPAEDKVAWERWTQGRTGFPLVDAGMRQLHATGFVHNRIRMVIASFATRYLGFDWRACARFYYMHLVDADICSNTAGWQWAAGVGVDSAPYFRRPLNPFRQSARFDAEGAYTKNWVPELDAVPAKDLHRWHDASVRARHNGVKKMVRQYPPPMIDVKKASDDALARYRAAAAAVDHQKKAHV
jgi:deoxyribodipyrimidine photo-lyase